MAQNAMDNPYFHYYNCNPKGKKTKDCVYRAMSLFLGISWEDTVRLASGLYMERGVIFHNKGFEQYLESFGYQKKYTKYHTIKDFIDKEAKEGQLYLFSLSGHATCIKNKKVWDIWDCSGGSPNYYYERGSGLTH